MQFFSCLTLSWHTLIIFRVYVIETKLDFVSFDDKNLQRQQKIVGERYFPIQNSYTDQFRCLSHSKDQKFVTSLVQGAIWLCSRALVRLFCTKDAKQLSADRFYSRDQTGNSIKFLVTKESFYAKNKINPQRLF